MRDARLDDACLKKATYDIDASNIERIPVCLTIDG
jgi:hypothetical protein